MWTSNTGGPSQLLNCNVYAYTKINIHLYIFENEKKIEKILSNEDCGPVCKTCDNVE